MLTDAYSLGGDAADGWRTSYVIVLLILGVLMMFGFVYWETKFKFPLMPMWIWRDRDFSLLLSILLLGFMSFATAMFWISLYIQRFWTTSALKVAVYLLPAAIMGILVNVGAPHFAFAGKFLTDIRFSQDFSYTKFPISFL